MTAPERVMWYRHIDAAVLRASVHTGDVVPRSWPDLDDDVGIEQWCGWVAGTGLGTTARGGGGRGGQSGAGRPH